MRTATKYSILAAILVALVACGHNSAYNSKPIITLCDTYTQIEILPLMAQVDLQADSVSAGQYIQSVKSLTHSSSDTTIINITDYLGVSSSGPLFQKLEPNVAHFYKQSASFKQSSLLGFSQVKDTAQVNEILAKSGLVKNDIVLRWIPYGIWEDKNYSCLVAFHDSFKTTIVRQN